MYTCRYVYMHIYAYMSTCIVYTCALHRPIYEHVHIEYMIHLLPNIMHHVHWTCTNIYIYNTCISCGNVVDSIIFPKCDVREVEIGDV